MAKDVNIIKKIVTGLILTSLPVTAMAGNLDSPDIPFSPASAMYSGEDLFNRFDTGADVILRNSAFVEPSVTPTPTGHTLDEIYSKAPVPDNNNGALPSEVLNGRTYWSLRTDGTWGIQSGTASSIGTISPTCSGTLVGTRWCDNGDGTISDLTTGLVWLKHADCWGTMTWDTAIMKPIEELGDGDCGLYLDGSVRGDWRLPTQDELYQLANGIEPVRVTTPRAFVDIQGPEYWSSNTIPFDTNWARYINLDTGQNDFLLKSNTYNLLPVRREQ